jgi:hypothetical protein
MRERELPLTLSSPVREVSTFAWEPKVNPTAWILHRVRRTYFSTAENSIAVAPRAAAAAAVASHWIAPVTLESLSTQPYQRSLWGQFLALDSDDTTWRKRENKK